MNAARRKALAVGFFWSALDQVARLGVTRLVFFPIALRLLGPASFGDFVIALSVCAVVGGAISKGFTNQLIRTANEFAADEQVSILKTATANTLLVTAVLLALSGLAIVPFADRLGGADLGFWLVVFMLHYLILNPTETMMVKYRIERNFRRMTLLHSVGVVALLAALVLFPLIGEWAVALSLLLWAIVPALWVAWSEGLEGVCVSTAVLRRTGRSVYDYMLGGFVQLSTGYLDRLMLAFWWPPEQVTVFFAAVSLALLFQSPATMLATFVLSLLARVEGTRLSSTKLLGYLLASFAGGLVVYGVGIVLGDLLLRLLYPEQHAESSQVMDLAVAASAMMTVSTLIRPFVVKLRPSSWIPRLSIVTLVVRIFLTWLFVRSGGYEGAALALFYGSLFTTLAWVAAYLSVLRHSLLRST